MSGATDAGVYSSGGVEGPVGCLPEASTTSVDGGVAMGEAGVDGGARLLTTSALVISMGLPGATRVWPQACLLAMIWIRDAGIRGATPLAAPVPS